MDFSTLPHWPASFPGESRHSWLTAAGSQQPMDSRDWWEMVQPSPLEPERPVKGARWTGLPRLLGDIAVISPTWRLSPQQRRVYCPACFVDQGNRRRWPTLIPWLDARQLQCPQHRLTLVYLDPARGQDPGHTKCQGNPELLSLYAWTRQWLRLEHIALMEAQQECLWRRDLIHMVCRNWTPARCHSAAGLGAWELWHMGWHGQDKGGMLNAGEPGRVGVLSAPERLGTLLLVYRIWRYFQGEMVTIPPLPKIAWQWLAHRWRRRLEGEVHLHFLAVVDNLTSQF